ncbi:MAG: PRC-barrel domain-containing protein [Candidatus Omnitrophota bacterium]
MLLRAHNLRGYQLLAKNGELGHVKDLFFDEDYWTVRYFIVDTGHWLPGKRVLISPSAIKGSPDPDKKDIPVPTLTTDQVKAAPPVDTKRPVSRQKEIEINLHYGWPNYWYTPMNAPDVTPTAAPPPLKTEKKEPDKEEAHLRSMEEVRGYHIQSKDGEFGHVEDFIADDADWRIRYLIVNTKNFLPGKNVLISNNWITEIDWAQSRISADLFEETINNSPEYDEQHPLTREQEEELFDHYDKLPYWNHK